MLIRYIFFNSTSICWHFLTGYCDGIKSIVNGSGINNSVAGETAIFSVFLRDTYLYPSPVMLDFLQVQIVQESDSHIIRPTIRVRETANGITI